MAGISKPYAEALFELALESNSLDTIYQEAADILEIFHEEPEFSAMLLNPRLSAEDKQSVISKAFPGMDKNLAGLMALMLRKGREAFIEAVFMEFIRLTKDHRGIVSARVYSAVAMTAEQLQALENQLALKMGKQVEIEAYVDPSLIGGLLIKAGGMVLDSTIKKHLQTLRKRLA